MNAASQRVPRGRRDVFVFITVLGGVCMLSALASDLFQPGLPAVAADLQAGTGAVQLTVTAMLFGSAVGQIAVGPLSDSVGRMRPLLAGLALFVVASLLCVVAPSVGFLIAMRFLQGIAAATGIALANAMVADHFRDTEAARVLSRLVMVSLLPPILAPLFGGQLLRVASWRWLFVVMAVVGVALLAAAALGLRESLPRERRSPAGLRVAFAGMGGLWRDAGFTGLTISAALMIGAFFAYLTASSFVLQDEYGLSPVAFSVLFSVNAVGMTAGTYLNHVLLARFSPRTLLAAGVVGCAVGGRRLARRDTRRRPRPRRARGPVVPSRVEHRAGAARLHGARPLAAPRGRRDRRRRVRHRAARHRRADDAARRGRGRHRRPSDDGDHGRGERRVPGRARRGLAASGRHASAARRAADARGGRRRRRPRMTVPPAPADI